VLESNLRLCVCSFFSPEISGLYWMVSCLLRRCSLCNVFVVLTCIVSCLTDSTPLDKFQPPEARQPRCGEPRRLDQEENDRHLIFVLRNVPYPIPVIAICISPSGAPTTYKEKPSTKNMGYESTISFTLDTICPW